jgi:hypothetical protein
MTDPELRASDVDRERVVEQLQAHAGEGRLSVEELEERTERALGARTVGDLAALRSDLPERRVAPRRPRRRPRPELRTFVAVMTLLIAIWALGGAGYFWPIWPLLGWGVFVVGPGRGRSFRLCGRRRGRSVRGTI